MLKYTVKKEVYIASLRKLKTKTLPKMLFEIKTKGTFIKDLRLCFICAWIHVFHFWFWSLWLKPIHLMKSVHKPDHDCI